ncbi:polysaccharide deacetylase family protein [Marivibrio halodurans]|uniref:Polysaccharide deacetylase family protein n=1 Tax=Marivibrio halodurans TaxID=2039722 RepID=A0A8J7S0L3_9PROT|nr:polysaccharide deacetylase family protein [Marivibrio halodurans]MBP5858125.1 polysaccharide deacetylase family protein [Marivibrio halodurans]
MARSQGGAYNQATRPTAAAPLASGRRDGAEAAAWARFTAAIDRLAEGGAHATFWWRDDDAGAIAPALDRLLSLAGTARPLGLAVIPRDLDDDTVAAVNAAGPGVAVLPHGLAHANHAPEGRKKAEFGADRPLATRRAEVEDGRRLLAESLGGRLFPLFVPPWNRINPDLADRLVADGWAGVSTFKARARAERGRRLNTHVDPIDWKGTRGFLGTQAALDQAVAHLTARWEASAGTDGKTGDETDPTEPTGLLTHHRDHDGGTWDFTAAFLETVAAHPAAILVAPVDGLGRDHEEPEAG